MPNAFPTVVCFGEILWDILPTGKQPGGAPFNVAVHLHQLGMPVQFISRVGDDELGAELLHFVRSKHLATDLIQTSQTHLTGVVQANVGNVHEVSYKIVQPVAWDYIQATPEAIAAVAAADAFVFGSLVARQVGSRETLYQLLKSANFKVFDVNVRPPHYTHEVVEYLMAKANMVKVNEHELAEITAWFAIEDEIEIVLPWLATRFELQAVCVTLGADGALLWTNGQLYRAPGVPVPVQDTIGSGDSFLAALLKGLLMGEEPGAALRFACATGAYVATYRGATPALVEADVRALMND